jgi:hypothetical protein
MASITQECGICGGAMLPHLGYIYGAHAACARKVIIKASKQDAAAPARAVRAQDAWDAVVDDIPAYSWWVSVQEDDGYPLLLHVVAENPSAAGNITKNVTALDLLAAYESLVERGEHTHCGGCDLLDDPDACTADTLLQVAVFGEVVYG